MDSFLSALGDRFNIHTSRIGEGWQVELPPRGRFNCRLSIGSGALDWYATICQADTGNEVYTDWNDYKGYDSSPLNALIEEKQNDIAWFVERWLAATDIRIIVDKHLFGLLKFRRAQWLHDGEWYGVILGDPENEPD